MTVRGLVTVQDTDISAAVNRLMQREQADAQGFVGLLIAESGLDEQARRPRNPADDARYWPDVSGSLGQQTVKYAVAYGLGDGSPTRSNIDLVLGRLMADVDLTLDIAARQYGAYYRQTGDWREACARYNGGPRASWATIPPANRANYQAGYAQAAQYIGSEEDPVSEHSFQFGFADLAAQLGADVVGEPVTDEYQDSGGVTRQITSKGEMVYASGGQPLFLAAVAP
jgi:hypothetical protein